MNSTGRLSHKGSSEAAQYAQKRQEQIERARQLREERKNGGIGSSSSSSVFKSAGHDSLHRAGSTNSRKAHHTQMSGGMNLQETTATTMFSSPSMQGGNRSQDAYMNGGMMGGAGAGMPQYSQMQ